MNKEETTAFRVMMGFYYKAGVYNKTNKIYRNDTTLKHLNFSKTSKNGKL
jgi:hypothetical protein